MNSIMSSHKLVLKAPLSGPLVDLSQVPDPVFSQKMVGDGITIDPINQTLSAPCAGKVIQLHRAGHAVTIESPCGLEILMHIGIDTVSLNGTGFVSKVAIGDMVQCGDALIEFDADYVGTSNLLADSELCVLISEILEKCGLANNEFNIKISNRKLSKGLLEELNIIDQNQQSISLRAIDKLDRVGIEGVRLLLGKGRKDKSGDFTDGAQLEEKQIIKIIEFLNSKDLNQLEQIGCKNKLFEEGINENFGSKFNSFLAL